MRDWKREYSMSKSTPSTPTAAKRRNFSQTGNTDGAETGSSGGSGWFGALGGVVGDWLNGWGLLSALRRRSGVGSGMRSMPATPPTNSHPSSPAHEHIELNNLNMECVASGGGGVGVGGGVGGGGGSDAKPRHVSVQGGMRRRAQSVHHCPRPSRHSYHEGSHPDSYILTTALIHSLNHRASQPCKEANCRLCAFKVNKVGDRLERPKSLSSRGVGGRFSERSSSSNHGDGEFSNSSSNHLHVTPLNSPTNSLLYAQISPLASPCPTTAASSSSAYPISQSSSNDPTLLSSEVSLTAPESESATLDLSSLTDVTLSSGLLSSSQLSLQMQESASLASGQFHTLSSCSELSPTASSSCTLTESYLDETFTTSATLPASGVSASAYHSAHNSPFRKSGAFESAMTTSAQSLPSRLPNDNKSSVNLTLPRPIVLSTGSLVLLPRRPSLVTSSTLSSASSFGHFMWEENPCYVRMEVVRAGQGHVFRSTTLERPAWCDACAHLVFYHAITCRNTVHWPRPRQ